MWDTRYRPLKFSDVLGQKGAVTILKNRLANGTALDTNYIFSGGPGQGKTTLARILARAMLCEQLDKSDPEPCNECDNCTAILNETSTAFSEFDAASRGTIENVRAIVDDLPFAVFGAPKRVYLLDECHRMSVGAQDVLLKPLEDKKFVGLFCTTESNKIRPAIKSRAEEHPIRKVHRDEILARMRMVLEKENVAFEDDAVLVVIDYCGGHVRDVLNKLEMVAQMGAISMDTVRTYLHLGLVSRYYEVLLCLGDPAKAVALVEQACEQTTPEEVGAGIGEAAMNAYRLANKMFADFVYVDRAMAEKVYAQYGLHTLQLAEYFTRPRRITRIGLLCDVLALARDGGKVQVQVTQSAPPIIIAAAPVVQAPCQTTAPAVQPEVSTAPAVAAVSVPPPPPKPAPTPQVSASPVAQDGVRADGVGPLGSKDPHALTIYDHFAVPLEKKSKTGVTPTKAPASYADNRAHDTSRDILTAVEWRREFETRWLRRE